MAGIVFTARLDFGLACKVVNKARRKAYHTPNRLMPCGIGASAYSDGDFIAPRAGTIRLATSQG